MWSASSAAFDGNAPPFLPIQSKEPESPLIFSTVQLLEVRLAVSGIEGHVACFII